MQSAYIQDLMAQAWGAEVAEMSLHTDDPAGTGANEATFSGYARQAATGASGGTGIWLLDEVTFVLPVDAAITHIGFWTAGGDFVEDRQLVYTATAPTNLKVTASYTHFSEATE